MNSKLIAVGVSAFGYGALVAWAFTADHLDGKMKRNQLILSEMLSRKEAQIVDLETRFLDRTPWNSPSKDSVQAVADQVTTDILDSDLPTDQLVNRVEDGIEIISIVEPNDSAPETTSEVTEEGEKVDDVVIAHRRRDLQSVIDNYTNNPDDRDQFVAKAGRALEFAGETPPFHISRDLYASDPDEGDGYAKITLTYFPRERILIDDDKDLIDDVDNYVGWRNLNRFGDESGDVDTVFVRNRRLLTDFEVVREEDENPPIHISYGMTRDEYKTNKAAGVIKFRDEDSD